METEIEGKSESLLELRELIAGEVDQIAGESTVRVFRPLTDGLGLESPKPKAEVPPPLSQKATRMAGGLTPSVPTRPDLHPTLPTREIAQPPKALTELMEKSLKPKEDLGPSVAPPPIPRATGFRRLLATLIDQIFVWGLFAGALLLTLRVLSGASPQFSPEASLVVKSPLFLRFAVLEFSTIWLSYLALGLGLLDMTFGMWVWGLRVNFGNLGEGRAIRKLARILLSFFFVAPVFPLIFLAVQRRGRNIVDALSGSNLYRVAL